MTPRTTQSLSQPALYEQVAERLRLRIYAHELAPGAWIDEQALALEYGISRTPLREALKVLATEGLVTLKPRRGCYVTELSEHDFDDIFPVLALLEGRCAAETAEKASDVELKSLALIHEALEVCAAEGDTNRFFETNQEFHARLQQLSGNRWLQQLTNDTRKILKLTRRDTLRLEGRLTQSLVEHRALLTALQQRDAAKAGQLMHEHVLSGRAALEQLHPR